MVKTVALLQKRCDLSSQEFHHHWREVHGPLVLKLPGICQYVQNRTVELDERQPSFDGVAEVWYEDLNALHTAFASPAHAAVRADERNFMRSPTPDSIFLVVAEDVLQTLTPGSAYPLN